MRNIVESFYKNASANRENIFAVDDNRQISYGEALRFVKSAVSFFAEHGITNERIIFKAERSVDTLIAILSCIASNNIYIPINPELSNEKIDSILKSSKSKYQIVFGNDAISQIENRVSYYELINHDIDDALVDKEIEKYSLDNDAFVIYTSGSTGAPKGVLKDHRAIASFVKNFEETFKFDEKLKICNQAPLFFDASMKDIYLCVYNGGSIYFPNKQNYVMPNLAIDYLNKHKINYICWVPSVYIIVAKLKTLNFVKPEYLKYAFFVGEVMPRKYINYWLGALPNVKYFNLYGSSEMMGVCLYKQITSIENDDIPLELGKPIANNNVYLDNEEIVVKSSQIAKCYLNEDADNSIFGVSKKGVKTLHTGDCGFINKNGDFGFLSRKDFQIKHMGYRIELQEIEHSILTFSYIHQACCVYDSLKDKIILAVSLNSDINEPIKTILTDVKNKLPNYMVPNKVIVMGSLPLSPNGKIDRVILKKELTENEH